MLLGKIYKEMVLLCQDGKAPSLQALMPRLGIESELQIPVEFVNVVGNSHLSFVKVTLFGD
jgi:hypothetical protein